MFIITNNQEIRISKGDDSGRFPILLNQGTSLEPSYFQFPESIYVGGKTSGITEVELDKNTFKTKCKNVSGLYSFYYLYGKWYLSGVEVNLIEYGITCSGNIQNEDAFSIVVTKSDNDLLRFYIVEPNVPKENWLVRKTFYKNGDIITEYSTKIPTKEVDTSIIDSDGNMNLKINSSDTDWLEPGLYNYFVTASLNDASSNRSVTSSVTNRLPLYVIDDDFDRGWE